MLRACQRASTRVQGASNNRKSNSISRAECVLGTLMEKGLSALWTSGSGGQRHWWNSICFLLYCSVPD